jgi:hypothetical protein
MSDGRAFLYAIYIPRPIGKSGIYMPLRPSLLPKLVVPKQVWEPVMFDVFYLLIGVAFLGGCVLYAIACDHL